jgi:hypothetical protein
MNRYRTIWTSVLCLGLITSAAGIAQQINSNRHPNLAAAQRLTEQAYQAMVRAQQANEYDLGGHAAQAKDLLQQANQQIVAATRASNSR